MISGGRQPSCGGTSRMNREVHVLGTAQGEIPWADSAKRDDPAASRQEVRQRADIIAR
jgi:hypothetical protein